MKIIITPLLFTVIFLLASAGVQGQTIHPSDQPNPASQVTVTHIKDTLQVQSVQTPELIKVCDTKEQIAIRKSSPVTISRVSVYQSKLIIKDEQE